MSHKLSFVSQRPLPPKGSQSLRSRDNRTMKKQKQNKPDGRYATGPRWDRWHIRIPNPKDQQKLIELYRKLGAKTKSDLLRARLLNESFKVITEDLSVRLYLKELDRIISFMRRIVILYNEAIKALNRNHSIASAPRTILKLEIYSETSLKLEIQAIQLAMAFLTRVKKQKYTINF